MVYDKAGWKVIKPKVVYNFVRDHFKAYFSDQKESKLKPFIVNWRLLDSTIAKDEVAKSIHKLRNNRAPGYNQISLQLLRNAPPELHDLIAKSLNNNFLTVLVMDCYSFTENWLTKESNKSICPMVFLIMLWKVISNIVLSTIQPTVEEYPSHSQSAYPQGRSSSEIAWCHRFLALFAQEVQEENMIIGIDMASAFSTIERIKLIETLELFLQIDEIKILLSNISLDIKTSSNISNPSIQTPILQKVMI